MLLQHTLLSSVAKEFHTMLKLLVFRGKMFLQHFLHHILPHQLDLPLVRNAEGGVQTDFIKMIFQQVQAKAVDGSDLSIMQERHLSLNML